MNKLNHPCKDTCSGWTDGYEKGGKMKDKEMVKIYILGVLLILMVLFGGCASTISHTKEVVHERHIMYHLYEGGECVDVGGGLFVENEGRHIDIYDNASCTHQDDGVLCNNVDTQDSCFIENRVFFVEGEYNFMTLHVLEY